MAATKGWEYTSEGTMVERDPEKITSSRLGADNVGSSRNRDRPEFAEQESRDKRRRRRSSASRLEEGASNNQESTRREKRHARDAVRRNHEDGRI